MLDLKSRYHQLPLAKDSRKYTAFATAFGIFEFLRVPMGLKGAASYFQRQIATTVLGKYIHKFCELYIDDVIIYADSEEELGHRLSKVLDRFIKFNIKAHPNKIKFGLTEIEYVGRMLSKEGTRITDNNIETVMEFKKPVNQGQLKSFLGMTGYLQQYIPKYSSYERPLMELATPYKKRNIIKWSEHTSQVFEDLKRAVQQAQTLFFL